MATASALGLVHAALGSSQRRAAACGGFGGVRCLQVVVPLDRSGQVPGTVSLHVQVLKANGRQRGVLFLIAGGPGQSALSVFGLRAYGFLYHVLFPGYTVVAFDSRGSGQSGALRCPRLQDSNEPAPAVISGCATALGPRRDFYATTDNVADVESVRVALHLERIGFWAVSYGTKVALAYAQTYPGRVDRLLLDSIVSPERPDPFETQTLHAIPIKLAGYCAGGACRAATPNFSADVLALANALAKSPIRGRVRELDGRLKLQVLDAETLLDTVVDADLDAGLAAALPAAIHAARIGRPQPLLRIVYLTSGANDSAADLSDALYTATTCADGGFPWPAGTPVAGRTALLEAAKRRLSTSALGGFGRWATVVGSADLCTHWPSPAGSVQAEPARYPNIPLLALSGALDMRTPTAVARSVVARFPRGRLLVVSNAGHSVVTSAPTVCLIRAIHSWLRNGPTPARCGNPQRLPPLGAYPAQTERRGPAGTTQTRTLAAKTLHEAEAVWLMASLEHPTSPSHIPGLDSGRLDASSSSFALLNYSITPGIDLTARIAASITVDGPPSFSGTIEVTGPAGASGVLTLSHNVLTGMLEGRSRQR